MKTVFQANDGSVYSNTREAEKRDRYLKDVDAVVKPFLKVEISAGQFIQRSKIEVRWLEEEGLRLLEKYNADYPEVIKRWKENPRGFVGRFLDDGNIPVYRIWGLLFSIDQNNRQWSQPYYAIEANKEINGQ